jgi:hypothetical protein
MKIGREDNVLIGEGNVITGTSTLLKEIRKGRAS